MTIDKLVYERAFDIPYEKRKHIGEYITKLREEQGIKISHLAALSQLNIADLHKIEYGTKNKINPFQLKAIGKALKVDYKEFYKIVGFLDEDDFIKNKNKLIKELNRDDKNYDIMKKFILESKNNLDCTYVEGIFLLLSTLSEDNISNLIKYGNFLKTTDDDNIKGE
ncbi:MAG: helix-turn-helix domain-containing protein [Fusobacteriaceae bacterium]